MLRFKHFSKKKKQNKNRKHFCRRIQGGVISFSIRINKRKRLNSCHSNFNSILSSNGTVFEFAQNYAAPAKYTHVFWLHTIDFTWNRRCMYFYLFSLIQLIKHCAFFALCFLGLLLMLFYFVSIDFLVCCCFFFFSFFSLRFDITINESSYIL